MSSTPFKPNPLPVITVERCYTLNHTAIDPIAGTPALTDKDNRVYVTTGRSGLIFYMTERMLDSVGLHLSDRVSLTRAGDNKCLVAPARMTFATTQ